MIEPTDAKGRPRRYVNGHSRKGKSNHWLMKPDDEIADRTARERARKLTRLKDCALVEIGGCSSRLEVHHLDGVPTNNAEGNLLVLCGAHHRLVHNGAIDLNNPIMPPFRVDPSGKRRYKRSSS